MISSIIIEESSIYLNMKASDAGPFNVMVVGVSRGSNNHRFIHFPNNDELNMFLESIGYEPKSVYCFGGDDWDDNAISEYDLIVWAKDDMDIPVDRRAILTF